MIAWANCASSHRRVSILFSRLFTGGEAVAEIVCRKLGNCESRTGRKLLHSLAVATLSQISLEHGLPASVEAERTILGAILLDNAAYSEAAERLVPE
ncbi:MAG TPA: DnaB-like helicase N-terminal domain-containing protein, partial [Acidobacteriaceae bacterium]|nr:DnaB-like helicase N-terminal domain-containing protein [Acidobacteriaceae bacterium]